ncbi:MAG: tRNA (adenosine(37)-N6)-threonylcarbamoyltransferase complex ATPase subunit type 1 TsaE [Mangrovicoccus sp.]|nr:tRNA (adenosine(37)-N6)-threonylcarbamoyltransferase complex ATPase subunit type 1 TsaE [Mangrovicoccus sp.]
MQLTIALSSPGATARFAETLAPNLRAGDVLLLEGEIGAGKSHFARAVISARLAALGRAEDIPSPTFTLVQSYEAADLEIWHSDLYRLTDPGEIIELGLIEAFDSALCLVEWPDRLGPDAPAGGALLRFRPGPDPDARQLHIDAPDADLYQRLKTAASAVADQDQGA